FLDDALKRGACACIAQQDRITNDHSQIISVPETRTALADFARWHRKRQDALIIGVTGSVGKTTTRHLLHTILSRQYAGVQSPHNFNNEIGVPLSLLEITPTDEFAVLELGASRLGDVRTLCDMAQPEVGILTHIAPAHLDEFGDLDTITRTKGELLEALPASGFAVLNGDDDRVRQLVPRASCRTMLVGERPQNDFVASRVSTTNTELTFRVEGCDYTLPAVGRHHLTSALAAYAVAREVGLSRTDIEQGFAAFQPAEGRCRPLSIGEWTVIDDTYNANPRSMQAACQVLCHWQGRGQRILIAGDMRALGPQSETFHRQLGEQVAAAGIDRLLVCGKDAHLVAERAHAAGMDAGRIGACVDTETLTLLLDMWLTPGDVLLVKGSRDMHMERVIEQIKRLAAERAKPSPFPRRAVA
ncbi:MAG: UDP-N-acetylmuramoyl-tripeptide--D-alanyl-D-alanine ligase, partial [Planctomycetaceae bacterium]|nr:UDP-N-acetylmuramoyl-tripeptide--D-alanyl-D-alanine ligase [Planctomycetaceae bacterium]